MKTVAISTEALFAVLLALVVLFPLAVLGAVQLCQDLVRWLGVRRGTTWPAPAHPSLARDDLGEWGRNLD